MKKVMVKVCVVIGCVFVTLAAVAGYPAFQTISLVVTTNTVPQVLGTNTLKFHKVQFVGMKAPRTNNTGTIWIQFNSTNNAPAIPLAAGAVSVVYTSEIGFDASDFHIDVVTDEDGVVAMLWDLF